MQNESYDDSVIHTRAPHYVTKLKTKLTPNLPPLAHADTIKYQNEQLLLSYISTPRMYGRLDDEDMYLNVMKLFFQSTDETNHRHQYFKQYIKNTIPLDHFMDVGIGDGAITQILSPFFKKATLVDTNSIALQQAFTKSLKNQAIKKIHGSISHIDGINDTYDLIVLSHMLYYLSTEEISSTLQTLFNHLNKDGKIIIVLSGGLDKEKIITDFNGHLISIDGFSKQIQQTFNHVSTHDINEYCSVYSKQAALHVTGFYLYDGGTTASHDTLADYLDQFKTEGGTYRFNFIQRFFVISK